MKPKLEAIIREVEIEAEYRGTIYEQTAVLRIDDTTFKVYDDHKFISSDMIGERFLFGIRALTVEDGVKVIDSAERGIYPPREQISKWSNDFCGEIVEFGAWSEEDTDELVLLDIGFGTILVSPPENVLERLRVGEYLCATATRTELVATPTQNH